MSAKTEILTKLLRARADQLGVRLGIAVVLFLISYLIAPSPWPLIWIVAVFATQIAEHLILDRPVARAGLDPAPLYSLIRLVTGVNAVVYTGLALYLWPLGPAGEYLAALLVCGALVHVTINLYFLPDVQLAGSIGPAVLMFAMPIYWICQTGSVHPAAVAVVVLANLLYLGHLIVGGIENNKLNMSLITAKTEADEQRALAVNESRSKSAFMAVVSHEIRTPLSAVTTAARLLNETELSPRQAELVDIMLNGGEVLLSLVNQVLDLSKIEAGKMQIDRRRVDLHGLLERIATLWTPSAAHKELGFLLEIDPDLPRFVVTDGLRLTQVLSNLVSNAVKFTDAGQISVRARGVREPGAGSELVLEVEDTGLGIAPGDQERMFQHFEQADSGVTRRFGGTGLGLAICRELTTLLGGTLQVQSTLGQGSTFIIRLPLAAWLDGEAETPPAEAGPAATPPPISATVAPAVPEPALEPAPKTAPDPGPKPTSGPTPGPTPRPTLEPAPAPAPAPRASAAPLAFDDGDWSDGAPESDFTGFAEGVSILVVEDHPTNRRLLELLLEPAGARLTMASSGPEALAACAAQSFQAILMDHQMPGMSGLEATRIIRSAKGPNQRTPIVAVTANAFEEQRHAWRAAGADGFLTKPIDSDALFAALEEAVSETARGAA